MYFSITYYCTLDLWSMFGLFVEQEAAAKYTTLFPVIHSAETATDVARCCVLLTASICLDRTYGYSIDGAS